MVSLMRPPFKGCLLLSEILCFTLCSKGFATVPCRRRPLSSCEAASRSGTGAWSARTCYSEVYHWNWVVPKSPNRNGYAGGWWILVSLQQHMQTSLHCKHWVCLLWYWILICYCCVIFFRVAIFTGICPNRCSNSQNIAAILCESFWQVSGAIWETLHFYWCYSDLRSDLSNGPNWVGAFIPFCQKTEIDAVIEMSSVRNVR